MTRPYLATPLRHLSAEDAPIPGALLPAVGGQEPLVRTPLDAWRESPAWRADPDGHLLAPQDVENAPDRQGVLVLHCPLRLSSWLDGRATVTDAEAVTLCVSILRGALEADRLGIAEGTWWVTSTGRPVLAAGGSTPWRSETDAILAELCLGTAERATSIGAARRAIADARLLIRDHEAVENGLFSLADPSPISAESARPARSVAESARGDVERLARRREPAALSVVRDHMDGEWADRVRDAWDGVRASWRSRAAGEERGRAVGTRRRVVLTGLTVCTLVLVGGLLLPHDEGDPAAAERRGIHVDANRPTISSSVSGSPSSPPTPSAESGSPEGGTGRGDAPEAVVALVERLSACVPEGCSSEVVENTQDVFPAGAATTVVNNREVALIDDYGGVAAYRVTAGEHRGAQIVVVVASDEEWLVRDVYDVTDQP
ncbi:hypothetical protein LJR045_001402 [Microbacterium sp. LjRoot45]|uniref:hypothetical protein n=1 Tax=Microbacterium sp. LjRoot45 TaxID=3342329 RepID=UPI003ED0450A